MMNSSNQSPIDGNKKIIIQDVHGSLIYNNSDDGLKKMLNNHPERINKISTQHKSQNGPDQKQFADKLEQIGSVLEFVDFDMEAAFGQLDAVNWCNRQGTYLDLKGEWINPPNGFSEIQFRGKLKVLVKTFSK